ncbi:MAG TPA: MFS transporter [Stellaceae bacterium]|nr:MFS transporter [Stellaceae bacterium]
MGELSRARRAGAQAPLWIWALAVTSLMQVTSALLTGAMPVIGPTLTAAAGVPPERIGHVTAMSAFGTMLFLVAGNPLLPRFGAVRLLQAGALLGAASLGLALLGWWPALLLAALLLGIGYGPSPPAGSDILQRHAPAHRRVLVFSIKQAAVPLGGAFGGLILPPLATQYGWRAGLAAIALTALATAFLVQPWRGVIDGNGAGEPPRSAPPLLGWSALMRPFRALAAVPGLPRLSYVGFAFAVVQGSLLGFYVTDMVDGLGQGLAEAGRAFAVLQGTGVVARVSIGWIADRIGSALATLQALTIASMAAALLAAAMASAWPWWAFLAAAGLMGFAATSWNGVYLAEIARIALPGQVGDATSGSTFVTFIGYVLGPASFAALVGATQSYRLAFALVALLPLSAALLLLRARRVTAE